jgi:hypothetical protein
MAALAGCSGGSHSMMMMVEPDMASPAPRITVGATDGTVALPMSDITISGTSSGGAIGSIALSHGAGTIELNGNPVQAAVYVRQQFNTPSGDNTLYQTMAVEPGRIWLLWLYCSPTTGMLTDAFYEATDGTTMTEQHMTGTCQDAMMMSTVSVQFPAIDMPPPPLITGYTVQGADVTVDATGQGTVTFGATTLNVFVFSTVDCTGTLCAASATDGWTELHSVLWDQSGARVCFGIIYLRTKDPSHVEVAYSLTLPDLTDPAMNSLLPATWSLP